MFRKLIIALLAFTFLLAACAPAATPTLEPAIEAATPALEAVPSAAAGSDNPTAAPAGIILTDGLGREVSLAAPAQKVVSLAPSNTEILFAIGAGAQTVGRDMFSDYPEAAKALPDIGGSMGEYNLEAIAALQPDLVLAAEINTPEQVKALEGLGLTVYYLANPKTIEEMYANLAIVAKLTGHEAEAAALVESLQARVAAMDEKIKGAAATPVVFYEVDASEPAKPWTAGPGSFIDQLIARAGGQNLTAAANITDPYPQVSVEVLLSVNPDLILLGDSMWGVTVESVAQRPGWESLRAVSEGKVFPFDDNLVSRPGPRLVDGLEALAKLLHPELFQ
jgi:iron complex transport system substrate-binding protein